MLLVVSKFVSAMYCLFLVSVFDVTRRLMHLSWKLLVLKLSGGLDFFGGLEVFGGLETFRASS